MSSTAPLKPGARKQIRIGVFGRPTLPALAAAISMIQAAGCRAVERAAIFAGADQYEPFDAVVVPAASPIAKTLRDVYNAHDKPAFPIPSDPAQFHTSPAAQALAYFLGLDILPPGPEPARGATGEHVGASTYTPEAAPLPPELVSEPDRASGPQSGDPAGAVPESAGAAVGDASGAVAPADATFTGEPASLEELRADLAAEGIELTERRDGGMVEATLTATTPAGQERLNEMAADALADGAVIDPATVAGGAAAPGPMTEAKPEAPLAPAAGRGRRGRTTAPAE